PLLRPQPRSHPPGFDCINWRQPSRVMISLSSGGGGNLRRRRVLASRLALVLLLLSCSQRQLGEELPQRDTLLLEDSAPLVISAFPFQDGSKGDAEWFDIWKNYRGAVIGVAVFVGTLVSLIVALLLRRTQRIQYERSLAEQLKFERLLSEISASMIAVDLER